MGAGNARNISRESPSHITSASRASGGPGASLSSYRSLVYVFCVCFFNCVTLLQNGGEYFLGDTQRLAVPNIGKSVPTSSVYADGVGAAFLSQFIQKRVHTPQHVARLLQAIHDFRPCDFLIGAE